MTSTNLPMEKRDESGMDGLAAKQVPARALAGYYYGRGEECQRPSRRMLQFRRRRRGRRKGPGGAKNFFSLSSPGPEKGKF